MLQSPSHDLAKVVVVVMGLSLLHICPAQKSDQLDFLRLHNVARALVGVGPMTWDDTVAGYALNYSNQRAAIDCKLVHSGGPYGENLYWGFGSGFSNPEAAMKLWVEEQKYYDPTINTCSGGPCLHYTQVVWRSSISLGCARVSCWDGRVFITCNYYPRGNIYGQRPY